MAETARQRIEFIYFADPMCSWCWGFLPVMAKLVKKHGDRSAIRLIMGGLRAYNKDEMDEGLAAYLQTAWSNVHERSGQPFNFDFLNRSGFVYDTEPACRAVVTARQTAPNEGLSFLARLQRAFYVDNEDTTDTDTLCRLAGAHGFDQAAFRKSFLSDDIDALTRKDFALTRQTGVSGFPTLLAGVDGGGYQVVAPGFSDLERVEARLTEIGLRPQ